MRRWRARPSPAARGAGVTSWHAAHRPAISRAERTWLHEVLDGGGIRVSDEQPHPQTHTRDRKD